MRTVDRLCACVGLFVVSAISASGQSSKKVAKQSAVGVIKPVVIDGANDEWQFPYPFSDKNAKTQYSVANDGAVLYVTVKSSDALTKGKFFRTGLSLFIDTKNKKSESLSINFLVDSVKQAALIARQNNSLSDTLSPGQEGAPSKGDESPVSVDLLPSISLGEIIIVGTNGYDGRFPFQQHPAGITAAAVVNDMGEVVWEIAVPFKVFSDDNNALFRQKTSIGIAEYPLTANAFEEIMLSLRAKPAHSPKNVNTPGVGERKHSTQRGGSGEETGGGMNETSSMGGHTGSGMGGIKNTNNEMEGIGISAGGESHEKEPWEQIEDLNGSASAETNGEKWLRATLKNETWKTIRLRSKN
jgi:hypothetical protein